MLNFLTLTKFNIKHIADSIYLLYLCSVKHFNKHFKFSIMYNEEKFNQFRAWFNQMFSLSFDGKFKGLSTLLRLYGSRFIEHFSLKLQKLMRHSECGYLHSCEVLQMRLSGHTIKLYNR